MTFPTTTDLLAIGVSGDLSSEYNITASARNGKTYYTGSSGGAGGFNAWQEWEYKPTHVFVQDFVDYQTPFREFPHQKFVSLTGCKYGPRATGPTMYTPGESNPLFITYTDYTASEDSPMLTIGNTWTYQGGFSSGGGYGANSIAVIGQTTGCPIYVCRIRKRDAFYGFYNGFLTSTDGGRTWSFNTGQNDYGYPQYLSYGSYNGYVSGLPGAYNDLWFLPICSDGTDFYVFTSANSYGSWPTIYKLGGYELEIDSAEVDG